MKKPKQFKG